MPNAPTLLLDSASLYYRSYFALPSSMTAPDGRPHHALRGFLSTIARLVEQHRPSGVVACWDEDWRPQWRADLVPAYKAHRVADGSGAEEEPTDLGPQVEAIAAVLDAWGLPRWGAEGFEADDVIGSAAAQLAGPCIVVSGDRDLVQVIDERTSLLLTVNGGMEKWPLLDPTAAEERFGVPPAQYVDLAVLRGDPSDGLPGVPGIGAKTAAALVRAFGSCAEIVAAAQVPAVERPMTPRLAAALTAAAEEVEAARVVATVVRDLVLPAEPVTLPRQPQDARALADLAAEWGVARQVAELEAALQTAQARQVADV
jgi:5'-3' exonuclease